MKKLLVIAVLFLSGCYLSIGRSSYHSQFSPEANDACQQYCRGNNYTLSYASPGLVLCECIDAWGNPRGSTAVRDYRFHRHGYY